MKVLDALKEKIATLMEWICMGLVALLTILSICAVFMRYCFGIVFIQTEELITFLFIATVFLGSVTVMYKKEHVSVTLLQMKAPPALEKLMRIFQYIVIIAVNALIFYASILWIATNMNFLTPGLRIPYWIIYVVVPISCMLSGIIAFIDLVEELLFSKRAAEKEGGTV